MKNIVYNRTLLYYDGPIVIVVSDSVGSKYICVLTEREEEDKYLCVPISERRIKELLLGEHDLRNIFIEPEIDEYYLLGFNNYEKIEKELSPTQKSDINNEWYPLPETFLNFLPAVVNTEEIARESIEQNTAIIHLAFDPPEAKSKPIISTQLLIKGLSIYQSIIRAAYKKAIKDLPREARRILDLPENYQTEVFGFSPSSFKVHIKAKTYADMFSNVDICRALEIIDTLLKNADDPEITLEILKDNKGHIASNYRKLIEYIIENNTPITYSWTVPKSDKIHTSYIYKKQAVDIYEKMITAVELNSEEIVVIGEFTKVDVEKNLWKIMDDEGKHYSGSISEKVKISLKGVTAGIKKYSFKLEETIEESEISAKEKYIYKMIEINKL